MALTREQVVALAKYEMEMYELERELPTEDVLRYGKEADIQPAFRRNVT